MLHPTQKAKRVHWFAMGIIALWGGVAAACTDEAMPPAVEDAGTDAIFIPEGAKLCEKDSDCVDAVDCTREFCNGTYCEYPGDTAMCSDGVFCNGVEECDRVLGCVPGNIEACSDNDVCTIDFCVEEDKGCMHLPRDFDDDGEADWHCEGGTDCDDSDPTRGGTTNEICGDVVDNDCDLIVDEADCGRPEHDVCGDAFEMPTDGVYLASTAGAVADYGATCQPGTRDLVFSFTLTETRDVKLTANGQSTTTIAVRTDCDEISTEFDCNRSIPGTVRIRALSAGTYFAFVSASFSGDVELTYETFDATQPPSNTSCASPLDVGSGGTFDASFVDVDDDVEVSCRTGVSDLVYSLTTVAEQDISVRALEPGGSSMTVAIQTTCGDPDTEKRCIRGGPAETTLHRAPAGTYYIVVEGASTVEVDGTVEISVDAPTDPPEGDACITALPIEDGDTLAGSLAGLENDVALSCGLAYRDAIYEFTLTERKDVTVELDGAGTFMYAGVLDSCGDAAMELRCTKGVSPRMRLRDLPAGTYFVVVESFSETSFNLALTLDDPTPVTPVMGNDACASAVEVPEAGGLYSGTTVGLSDDYTPVTFGCAGLGAAPDAAFKLELSDTRMVTATTEGSAYDTVLHLRSASCADPEIQCDDNSGDADASLISRSLPAGVYYFVVDGFNSASGDYFFEVTTTP